MSIQPNGKKQQILTELGKDSDEEELIRTMDLLDNYTVSAPSSQSTDALIALLKPTLEEQAVKTKEISKEIYTSENCERFTVLQLVQPQAMLLSKWFVVASTILFIIGLVITNEVDGNTAAFLANASPVLGIITVLYEFRAKYNGVSELEAACPYSPAQLAAARLLVVLGYDILLCLAATHVVSYWQGHVLWQVTISWLGPLLFLVGIALLTSLRLGLVGGCLVAVIVWPLQMKIADGSLFAALLPTQSAIFADFISSAIGVILILYAYKHWDFSERRNQCE